MRKQIVNYNYTFDALRVLLCFAVILLHVPFSGNGGQLIKAYTRSAVPIFFMISGYLAYQKDNEKKIIGMAKKMIATGVLSILLYFLWEVFILFPDLEKIKFFLMKTMSIKKIFVWILFNETIVGAHLWFLFALAYCHISTIFLTKKVSSKVIIGSCIILISINYYVQVIYPNVSIYVTRNWLLIGLPSYYMGLEIKKHCRNICLKLSRWSFFMLGALLGVGIEHNLLGEKELYLSSYILAVLIFSFCCVYQNIKIPGCNYLSKLTIYIYILQLIALSIVNKIFEVMREMVNKQIYVKMELFKSIFVFVICICSASIIVQLKNNKMKERE